MREVIFFAHLLFFGAHLGAPVFLERFVHFSFPYGVLFFFLADGEIFSTHDERSTEHDSI